MNATSRLEPTWYEVLVMIPVISHIRGECFNFTFQVQNSLTDFFLDETVWLENNIQVCCKFNKLYFSVSINFLLSAFTFPMSLNAVHVYVPPSVLLIADLNSSWCPFRVRVPFSNCQKYFAGGNAWILLHFWLHYVLTIHFTSALQRKSLGLCFSLTVCMCGEIRIFRGA